MLNEPIKTQVGFDPKKIVFSDDYMPAKQTPVMKPARNYLNKSPKEIHNYILSKSFDDDDRNKFISDLSNSGYPYEYKYDVSDAGKRGGFYRKLEGHSKNWNNKINNPDGSTGGYTYGRRFLDGGYENIDKKTFNLESKNPNYKASHISDTSDAYNESPQYNNRRKEGGTIDYINLYKINERNKN